MKTLILSIPMGHLVKNILRTGVFRFLKESGVRLVILTFESDSEGFAKEFSDNNVIIEKLVKHKPSFWEIFIGGVADRIYRNRIKNETLEILDRARLRNKKLLNFLKIRVVGKLVGKSA